MNPSLAQMEFNLMVNGPFYLKYINGKVPLASLQAIRLEPQSFIKVRGILKVDKPT